MLKAGLHPNRVGREVVEKYLKQVAADADQASGRYFVLLEMCQILGRMVKECPFNDRDNRRKSVEFCMENQCTGLNTCWRIWAEERCNEEIASMNEARERFDNRGSK